MKNLILSVCNFIVDAVGKGKDIFDTAALVVFVVFGVLLAAAAVIVPAVYAYKLVSAVPIIGVILVGLLIALMLRASWIVWRELYDNNLLSIKNLLVAYLGTGIALVGDWIHGFFEESE